MRKIIAIVQARTESTRFPGKVLKTINEFSLIEILLKRLSKSKLISKIVLATTNLNSDDFLCRHVSDLGFDIYRGEIDDVLSRFYYTAKLHSADIVVRITGDCPLIDFEVVDRVIQLFLDNKVDYAANTFPPSFPDGLDVSVFSFSCLEESFRNSTSAFDKEHVTPYMRKSESFSKINLTNKIDLSKERWTVDEFVDLEVVKGIFDHFYPNIYFCF